MASNFVSTAELPIEDGVGTVGYEVFDADGTQLAARSTSGVTRLRAGTDYGIYHALITVAVGVTAGVVVWDDGAGNISREAFWIGLSNTGNVSVGDYDSELDATWGGYSADSYITLADAEVLVQNYVWDTAVWSACTGQKKDQSLRMATRRLDMHNYVGKRLDSLQALEWPRTTDFVLDVTSDQAMADVQLATVLEALDLIGQKGMKRHQQNIAAGLKQISESVGPVRDQYTYQSGGATTLLCAESSRIMARYIVPKRIYRA